MRGEERLKKREKRKKGKGEGRQRKEEMRGEWE